MQNSSLEKKENASTSLLSSSPLSSSNYARKSQQIQRELFKLKIQKRYAFLSKWKIISIEFFDENFDSSIKVQNSNLQFELELSDQILDTNELQAMTIKSLQGINEDGNGEIFHRDRSIARRQHRNHRRHRPSFSSASSSSSDQNGGDGGRSGTRTRNDMIEEFEIDFLSEPSNDGDNNDDDDNEYDDEEEDEAYSIIEDSEFILRGDLIWDEGAKARACLKYDDLIKPILECKLFEYDLRLQALKFSGPNVKLAFDVKYESTSPDDTNSSYKSSSSTSNVMRMVLKSNRDKILISCIKMISSDNYDKSYDFASMFNNEFLADYEIKSNTGQIFHVHKPIIWLTLKEKTEYFLQMLSKRNLDSDSLELVLFYCYSDCLPTRLDINLASITSQSSSASSQEISLNFGDETRLASLVQFLEEYNELKDLNELLKVYMNNFSFKLKSDTLINEIMSCVESINTQFRYDDNNVIYQRLFLNPSKLCQVILVSFEQFYLAFIKIIRLLDMYSYKQEQLSKDEKSEFVKKIKNSLPFFLSQMENFLNSVHKHSLQMTDTNKREVAEYMIPQIDVFVKESLALIKSSQLVIERIVNVKKKRTSNENVKSSSIGTTAAVIVESGNSGASSSAASSDDLPSLPLSSKSATAKLSKKSKKLKTKLGRTIKNAMHLRELKKIQKFNEKINKSFRRIEEILEKYECTNQDAKVDLVYKELSSFVDNIVHDIPRVLRKLKDYSKDQNMLLNKALKIYDFKFAFKLLASKTEWFLNEVKSNREIIDPYLSNLCMRLSNSELNKELEKLCLASVKPNEAMTSLNASSPSADAATAKRITNVHTYFDSFFKSKPAENNRLARQAYELFKSQHMTDLCLELYQVNDDEDDARRFERMNQVRVHACIIASRCEWFKLALSSGMRESIDRRIVLHDDHQSANRHLFYYFVAYLYSGRLDDRIDVAALAAGNDELIDLLTIADKYECNSLKDMIEKKLIVFVRNQYEFVVKHQKLASVQQQSLLSTSSSKNEQNNNASSFLLVLIDYLNLSDRFKLDVLMALCISILVEHVDNLNSNKTVTIDLDSIEEFKQLANNLQTLVREKHSQHMRIKEKLNQRQKRRLDKITVRDGIGIESIIRHGRVEGAPESSHLRSSNIATGTLILYGEDDENIDEDEADLDEDNDGIDGRSLVHGMPAHTSTNANEYLSASSGIRLVETNRANEAIRTSRLDELLALAHPLIVLDGILLENTFTQLKEIIADAEPSIAQSTDEHLVKLLIRHDCDLNRVIPILLNLE